MPRGLNLYIFLAFVLFAVGSVVARKLREQAAKKRRQDAQRRREEEILRTGRDPIEFAPTPEARLELQQQRAVESRRASELEELRRRRAGGDHPAPAHGEAPAGIVIQIPGVGAPIVIKPIPRAPGAARSPVPTAPGRAVFSPSRATPVPPPPPASQRPTRQRPGPKRKSRPGTTTPTTEPAPADAAASTVFRAPAATPAQSTGSLGHDAAFDPPRTPAEWRRAMILREVLGTPVGMREPGSGVGPMS